MAALKRLVLLCEEIGVDPALAFECPACLGSGWAWAADYDADGGVDAATREPCTCPLGQEVVR